ncbi:MAG: hypothetical protein R3F65_12390 [bacterium]
MITLAAVLALGCEPIEPPPDAGPDDDGGPPPALALDDFDTRCGSDADCLFVLAGDVCDCDCAGGAINRGARADYLAALDAAREACGELPDCAACPPAFVWCEAGLCRARTGSGPCGCAADELCVQRYDGACRGGGLQCVGGPAECAADPRVPIARRVCAPGCELVLCGDALWSCGGAGGTCGGRAATPEHPAAMHCHGF